MNDEINFSGKVKREEDLHKITPELALNLLKEGNQRFVNEDMHERDHLWHIRATIDSQHPFAIVLGCVDSRVQPSIIFDQGIGDLLITRIAGNIINDDILGSMEYACSIVKSKLILVLGHSSCGAVKGACDNIQLGHLSSSLKKIRRVISKIKTIETYDRSSKNLEFVNRVAHLNVVKSVEDIKAQSPILRDLYQKKEIDIIGAIYNHRTGEVTFL